MLSTLVINTSCSGKGFVLGKVAFCTWELLIAGDWLPTALTLQLGSKSFHEKGGIWAA